MPGGERTVSRLADTSSVRLPTLLDGPGRAGNSSEAQIASVIEQLVQAQQQSPVTSALASALDSGQLGSAAFDAAVQRVTALRDLVR